jgi:hypothetical protein
MINHKEFVIILAIDFDGVMHDYKRRSNGTCGRADRMRRPLEWGELRGPLRRRYWDVLLISEVAPTPPGSPLGPYEVIS